MERQLGDHTYRLFVPTGLTSAAPLLLHLHGGNEPVDNAISTTGWTGFAQAHGFIVAFPIGTSTPINWNFNQGSSDVAFLKNVVTDISATWCVNPARVHAAGFSNGAMMAERLACDAPDVFASVAALAGASPDLASVPSLDGLPSIPGTPCTPSRPVAVGIFQGALDPVSSYAIGVQNRDAWLTRNQCSTTGVREPQVLVEAIRYADCAGGVEVIWRVYPESHNWPVIPTDNDDIKNRMWALFQRNPRP